MLETKDPAIKLFGKTIQLLSDGETPANSGEDSSGASGSTDAGNFDHDLTSEEDKKENGAGEELEEEEKDLSSGKPTGVQEISDDASPVSEELTNGETSPGSNEDPKAPSKTEKEECETPNSEEKTLKKPDKILPCPRCNSMDTKFCYYNNYNINQPRHLCKSCQRYWTDGGTMRNVPVGAGRRKNKNSSSNFRHITISEALQTAQIDAPNGIHHHPALKSNGTVLNFGADASLSESMASVLSIAEKTKWNGVRNGLHKVEHPQNPTPCGVGEIGDDRSSGSSTTDSNSMEEGGRNCAQESLAPTLLGLPSQIPCLPGLPWPYPWNSAVPPPAFCHPAIPIFYPANYWNCTLPGAWTLPWLSPPPCSTKQNGPSTGPNSPTLGKHSRDANVLEPSNLEEQEPPKQRNSERNIWVPKTLRIDDPDEAAKSSIWATLGIKNDSMSKGGLFKAFQPKSDEKNHVSEASAVLRANPAAFSRSLNFQESS